MKSRVETVRLSDKSKDLLVKIKRITGIQTWNIICRLAFCLSLRDKSMPPPASEGEKPAIEISWKVFAGELAYIYSGLLLQRFKLDQAITTEMTIDECLKRHIFRGLGSLDAATNHKNQGSLESLFKINSVDIL
jgi:DNA sulfur modification protein DndE